MILLLTMVGFILFVSVSIVRVPLSNKGYIWIPVIGNLGFIGQYVVAYSAGIWANACQFLDHLQKQHLPITLSISLLFYFLFQIFQTYMIGTLLSVMGYYAFAIVNTFFEQYFAIFFSYSLLVLFKEYNNLEPTPWIKKVIGSAYAAYVVQQWAIIPLAVALAYANLYPLVAILILCLTAPFLAWGMGMLVKMIPGANHIF